MNDDVVLFDAVTGLVAVLIQSPETMKSVTIGRQITAFQSENVIDVPSDGGKLHEGRRADEFIELNYPRACEVLDASPLGS